MCGCLKAFSGFCVCVCVCIVGPHDKIKTAEATITKLATGIVHHKFLHAN